MNVLAYFAKIIITWNNILNAPYAMYWKRREKDNDEKMISAPDNEAHIESSQWVLLSSNSYSN